MSTALALPEKKFTTPVGALEMRELELEVVDQPTLETAAALRREVKAWLDQIDAECDPLVKKAFELHRGLTGQRNKLKAPFLELEESLKAKCDRYVSAQRKAAAESAAKAEAEAREAREAAAVEARELAEAGQLELAGVVEDQALQIVPPPPPPPPRAEGLSARVVWHAEVSDWQAFLKGILDGKIPQTAVMATPLLGQQVRALKSQLKWPGVRVWNSESTGRR